MNSLGDLYASQYSRFLGGGYAKGRQRRYAVVMDAFAPLFSAGGGRRLLDYGCGTGAFLQVARERGEGAVRRLADGHRAGA